MAQGELQVSDRRRILPTSCRRAKCRRSARRGSSERDSCDAREVGSDNERSATHVAKKLERESLARFSLTVRGGTPFVVSPHLPGPIRVGSAAGMDVRVVDPLVSRRHFTVEPIGAVLRLEDSGSTNGTRVNGVRVGSAYLEGGEEIAIGGTTLHVLRLADERSYALPPEDGFGRTLGSSAAMRRIYPLCHRLAPSPIAFLIEGEGGTGKELCAESIHEASPRASGPFVVVDAGTLPGADVEAVLFGSEATSGRVAPGLVEQAHGGTLFVAEVGALPLDAQKKLARVVERGELLRKGGTAYVRIDVRFVASTKRNLEEEVHQGRFDEDLLLAVAAARIALPPLRRREGDAGLLARHFWRRAGQTGPLPEALASTIASHPFPGNVRELERMVARHVLTGDPRPLVTSPRSEPPPDPNSFGDLLVEDLAYSALRRKLLDRFEGAYVKRMLEVHHGNVSRAAASSGLARRYFYTLKSRSEK